VLSEGVLDKAVLSPLLTALTTGRRKEFNPQGHDGSFRSR